MRYVQGGGLTPGEREQRDRLRAEAAERFTQGDRTEVVARECTIQGAWKLLCRHGWSAQVLVRRALERDEEAIEVWKAEVWSEVKGPRPTWAPRSVSRTMRAFDTTRSRDSPTALRRDLPC